VIASTIWNEPIEDAVIGLLLFDILCHMPDKLSSTSYALLELSKLPRIFHPNMPVSIGHPPQAFLQTPGG
jgi:hypothetical protein